MKRIHVMILLFENASIRQRPGKHYTCLVMRRILLQSSTKNFKFRSLLQVYSKNAFQSLFLLL